MIGVGDVTQKKSAPSFNKIENSRLVAVGSRTPETARKYAEQNGIDRCYDKPEDVISDPEVNAVYIATPPGSHLDYAMDVIEAGKPVYIEKPMARTYEECMIINDAAASRGVPVYVAYYRRSLDYFAKVREILDSGSMGRILTLHIDQHFPARPDDYNKKALPWRVKPNLSGGGYFHDMGCHALDIIFYMLGDPLLVKGSKTNLGGLYMPEDTITAELTLPGRQENSGQILMTGNWSFIVPKAFEKDRVYINCEKGRLSFSIFSFEPIIIETDPSDPPFGSDQGARLPGGAEARGLHRETITTIQPEHIQMPFIKTIVAELTGQGHCPSTGTTAAVTSRVMDEIISH